MIGILHSPVYTFFEKACIVELNADVETGNLKFEISSKLKELSQSTPFSFRLQAFSSYATPQIGFFQRNLRMWSKTCIIIK